uniref:Uncharacterized protein n=1 Tax=Haptolina ericina TaxID=156174 RepID=A0A7S3AE45_9EUKA|eukprot:CAMPEP_0181232960 /NCGR_PEP_ID=MMETSP1096-20121128/36054_1 /TAXON_ID=156174 ORGANISM="Chrysochromulina ericina, Strain CCMP281" /NCGR_SAMPLE_ID=MMETSP1096 /ASSEMBLY_ACC=CAM_ASM_000453 /LENGTH=353 /DNA_ID=CAMNT_0023327375 /DNA_START=9 /DNA_END=1070 /DNA_ORIENTATION=+
MKNGWSALMVAAAQGHAQATKSLLRRGANPNRQLQDSRLTPLMAVAATSMTRQEGDCTSALIQNKADLALVDRNGTDALMFAARNGRLDMVEIMLQGGIDYNRKRPGGATALMDAAASGHEAVVRAILDYGQNGGRPPVKIDERDDQGQTALMHAAKGGKDHTMMPLLQAGASTNLTDNENRSAATLAASNDVAARLLAHGADPSHILGRFREDLGLPKLEMGVGRGPTLEKAIAANGKVSKHTPQSVALGFGSVFVPKATPIEQVVIKQRVTKVLGAGECGGVSVEMGALKVFMRRATSKQVGATLKDEANEAAALIQEKLRKSEELHNKERRAERRMNNLVDKSALASKKP